AGLAGANMWATGWAAMRAAAPAYIVPFMFVYEPALLTLGAWTDTLHATVTATVGVILLAAGLFGYLLRPATAWQRALLIAAALLLIKPGWITDLIGLLLAGVVIVAQLAARRAAREAQPGI
ncbi:MAG TPA: DUF3394 domain-containing protein, partial [Burkholderiaceae bacterium]|nr:DUF3394 domain-containing protein [Burkholderiaceae bacterium]